MTGHKTRAVFERYNIESEGDLDMAARRLDNESTLLAVEGQPEIGEMDNTGQYSGIC